MVRLEAQEKGSRAERVLERWVGLWGHYRIGKGLMAAGGKGKRNEENIVGEGGCTRKTMGAVV